MSDVIVVTFEDLFTAVQQQWKAVRQYRKLAQTQSQYLYLLDSAYKVFNPTIVELLDQHFEVFTIAIEVDEDTGKRLYPRMLIVEYGKNKFRVPVPEIQKINGKVVLRIRQMLAKQQGDSPTYGFSQEKDNLGIAQELFEANKKVILDRTFQQELVDYSFEPMDLRHVADFYYDGGEFTFFEGNWGEYYLCLKERVLQLPLFTLRGNWFNGWFVATHTAWKRLDVFFDTAGLGSKGTNAVEKLRWLVKEPDGESIAISSDFEFPPHIGEIVLESAFACVTKHIDKAVKALVNDMYQLVGLVVESEEGKFFIPSTTNMIEAWDASHIINLVPPNLNLTQKLGLETITTKS